MIKTVLDNIFKAHDEHRGLDNHINLSAENLIDVFNNVQSDITVHEDNLLSFIRIHLDGEWRCEKYGGTIALFEIPDNWVYVELNPNGTVSKAFYV